MTEQEWLESDNPYGMLLDLHSHACSGRVGIPTRRLRLFCCACCRRIWHLLKDERGRKAIEMVERFLDGQANIDEIRLAADNVEAAWNEAEERVSAVLDANSSFLFALDSSLNALWAAAYTIGKTPSRVVPGATLYGLAGMAPDRCRMAVLSASSEAGKDQQPTTEAEKHAHLLLLRDCLGNPFQPITLNPGWLTQPVLSIAQSIYSDPSFDQLPMLADALVAAGCDNSEILSHCQEPGPHVKGCWAIDLVLGKNETRKRKR